MSHNDYQYSDIAADGNIDASDATLMELYAGQAMHALSNRMPVGDEYPWKKPATDIVTAAWNLAEAMMAERKRRYGTKPDSGKKEE